LYFSWVLVVFVAVSKTTIYVKTTNVKTNLNKLKH